MKITEIKESGCNNILMWAISNNADIKSDIPLQSIINDELFYIVTIEDVNLLELFRLTQTFRNKLRIINENQAACPNMRTLAEKFPDSYNDPESPETKLPMSEVAEHVVSGFINLAMQMNADSDIITQSAVRFYLPMISRTFDVQIPVAFMDVVESLDDKSARRFFNNEYPDNLSLVLDDPNGGIPRMLNLLFVKLTTIVRRNQRLDKYMQYTKFAALSKINNNKLYKLYLLGFHKFNPVSRGEVRCTLFNINQDSVRSTLKAMKINSPLMMDFAVQMPIQLMQILANTIGPDMLTISYESSMASILDEGLLFNDFVAPEAIDESGNSAEPVVDEERTNAISAYRVRLTEANQLTLNALQVLLSSQDTDVTAAFATLPAMYMTKAVFTVNVDQLSAIISYLKNSVLEEMFREMVETSEKILQDISAAK